MYCTISFIILRIKEKKFPNPILSIIGVSIIIFKIFFLKNENFSPQNVE